MHRLVARPRYGLRLRLYYYLILINIFLGFCSVLMRRTGVSGPMLRPTLLTWQNPKNLKIRPCRVVCEVCTHNFMSVRRTNGLSHTGYCRLVYSKIKKLYARMITNTNNTQFSTPDRPTRPVTPSAPRRVPRSTHLDYLDYLYEYNARPGYLKLSSNFPARSPVARRKRETVADYPNTQVVTTDDDEDSDSSSGVPSVYRESECTQRSHSSSSTVEVAEPSRRCIKRTKTAMGHNGFSHGGGRVGVTPNNSFEREQLVNHREGNVSDDSEGSRSGCFYSKEKHASERTNRTSDRGLGESGQVTPGGNGGHLGAISGVLLEGSCLSSSREGDQSGSGETKGPDLSELRGCGESQCHQGCHGRQMGAHARSKTISQSVRVQLNDVFGENQHALCGLALRFDSDSENELCDILRIPSSSFAATRGEPRSGEYLEGDEDFGVAVFEPPRVVFEGDKAVVSFLPESNCGDSRRCSTGGSASTPVSSYGGPYEVRSRDQRSLSLFYISRLIRDKSGRTMAVLALCPGQRDPTGYTEDILRSEMHEDEPIESFVLDPSTVPGFCCATTERTLCDRCIRRRGLQSIKVAGLRCEHGKV